MLAAAPELNSTLGLVQVVLTSIAEDREVAISDNLKQHILSVLQAALVVAANPGSIVANTPSEAIELAIKLKGHPDLINQVSQIQTFNEIREDVAEGLLASIRPYAA